MRKRRSAAALALAAGAAVVGAFGAGSLPRLPAVGPGRALAQAPIPRTEGWVLVVSRCVICHSVEIAVQQRQGPRGWNDIMDRMVGYGMPLQPEEREVLIAYLVRHFGDPRGR